MNKMRKNVVLELKTEQQLEYSRLSFLNSIFFFISACDFFNIIITTKILRKECC